MHECVPIGVLVDGPGVVVSVLVGDEVFPVVIQAEFDQGDDRLMDRDDAVPASLRLLPADHVAFLQVDAVGLLFRPCRYFFHFS